MEGLHLFRHGGARRRAADEGQVDQDDKKGLQHHHCLMMALNINAVYVRYSGNSAR